MGHKPRRAKRAARLLAVSPRTVSGILNARLRRRKPAVNDNTIEFMPPEIHLILLTAVVLLSFFAARAYAAQEEGKAECGTGVIEKRAESEFSLMVDNNKCLLFSLAEDAVCFLNEKTVELSAVTSGRTVRVIFKNIKGRLLATGIVLMPLGADFAPRRG